MKSIDWNQMSELGLIERINREILHPLGLAVSRELETGHSVAIFVADDGIWEYHEDLPSTILTDEDVKSRLATMVETSVAKDWKYHAPTICPKCKGENMHLSTCDGDE